MHLRPGRHPLANRGEELKALKTKYQYSQRTERHLRESKMLLLCFTLAQEVRVQIL